MFVASNFMRALSQDGSIDEDSLSSSELDRVYGPLRGQVTDSIHRQETSLANIQVCQLNVHIQHTLYTTSVKYRAMPAVDPGCLTGGPIRDIYPQDCFFVKLFVEKGFHCKWVWMVNVHLPCPRICQCMAAHVTFTVGHSIVVVVKVPTYCGKNPQQIVIIEP